MIPLSTSNVPHVVGLPLSHHHLLDELTIREAHFDDDVAETPSRILCARRRGEARHRSPLGGGCPVWFGHVSLYRPKREKVKSA